LASFIWRSGNHTEVPASQSRPVAALTYHAESLEPQATFLVGERARFLSVRPLSINPGVSAVIRDIDDLVQ
jgi:hypothetical protein